MTINEWWKGCNVWDGSEYPPYLINAVWEAATLAERERCAMVCEGRAEWYQEKEGHEFSENQTNAECGCGDCADAIRKEE